MKKFFSILLVSFGLSACAGGADRAATLPTPILCKTIFDLSPTYVMYDEYIAELNRRNTDCKEYVGETKNIKVSGIY